ncbi:MAG: tetratricopeptide repeat protein, partial [Pseudomonadota bacterium]
VLYRGTADPAEVSGMPMVGRLGQTARQGVSPAAVPPALAARGLSNAEIERLIGKAGPDATPVLHALIGEHRVLMGDGTGFEMIADARARSDDATLVLAIEARLRLEIEEPDAAIAVLEGARARRPGDVTLALYLGDAMIAAGRPTEALDVAAALLDDAIRGADYRAATEGAALVDRAAAALAQIDGAEEALDAVRAIADLHPSQGRLSLVAAHLALAAGLSEAAAALAEEATVLSPGLADAWFLRARLVAVEDSAPALALLKQGVAQSADNARLKRAVAGLQERRGEIAAAIETYRALLAANPGSLVVANNLAALLSMAVVPEAERDPAERARLVEATRLAERLAGSDVPEMLDTRGWIAVRNGALEEGIALLERAGIALPENATVHYHLGIAYVQAGRIEEGQRLLRRALSLDTAGHLAYQKDARRILARAELKIFDPIETVR